MQYNQRTDDDKESVRLSYAKSVQRSEPGTAALRLAAKDVPQPSRPDEPATISRPEKAMAASVPGSEYWLP